MREAALKYLDQLPRFSPIPGVEREQALLEFLDHPEKKIPMIHVTGTNGKGSVSSMFAEVFQSAGDGTPDLDNFRMKNQVHFFR